MTASILQFPQRHKRSIRVVRERAGAGWLVLTPRGHGWLHGSYASAIADAQWLAANHGFTTPTHQPQ
jgi:hypothetical protein